MGGLSSEAAMNTRYADAPRGVRAWWTAGVVAAVGYGIVLAGAGAEAFVCGFGSFLTALASVRAVISRWAR